MEAAREMTKTIYERIDEELKKQKIKKKDVAKKLGYKNASGFTMALKRGSLRLNDFMVIANMLNIRPMDLFPGEIKADVYNMTMYEVIESICLLVIERHKKEDHTKHNKIDEKIERYFEKDLRGGAR